MFSGNHGNHPIEQRTPGDGASSPTGNIQKGVSPMLSQITEEDGEPIMRGSYDERQPLIPSERTSLNLALEAANATLNFDGTIQAGSFIITPTGVKPPGLPANSRISMKTWMIFLTAGFLLSLASGSSGFEGAYVAKGMIGGIGGWAATSVLNNLGWVGLGCMAFFGEDNFSSTALITCTILAFIASIAPYIMAARGFDEVISGDPDRGTHMQKHDWEIGLPGAVPNVIVSTPLSATSLLLMWTAVKVFWKRLSSPLASVWDNRCGEAIAKIILVVVAFPALYSSLVATVVRGYATDSFFADDVFHDQIGGDIVFFGSGTPGFGMFFVALIKLMLFIEKIIAYIIQRLFFTRLSAYSGIKLIINSIALSLAIGCAYFVWENYDGMAQSAWKMEWWLMDLIRKIIKIFAFFRYPADFAAAGNLVMRAEAMSNYGGAYRNWKRSQALSVAELQEEETKAQKIYDEYLKIDPDAARTFKNLSEAAAEFFSPEYKFSGSSVA